MMAPMLKHVTVTIWHSLQPVIAYSLMTNEQSSYLKDSQSQLREKQIKQTDKKKTPKKTPFTVHQQAHMYNFLHLFALCAGSHNAHVKTREQLAGASSLLPHCVLPDSNSDCHV